MTRERITVSADIDAETAKIVEDGLDRFNERHNGPDPTKPLWLVYRDDQGNVLGGLKGLIQWDWFVVAMLWVEEEKRRRGIGQRLLREAEDAARKHGCRRVRLATMTFQAPEFYRKFGYVEECRLLDVPPGHAFIWMSKTLAV